MSSCYMSKCTIPWGLKEPNFFVHLKFVSLQSYFSFRLYKIFFGCEISSILSMWMNLICSQLLKLMKIEEVEPSPSNNPMKTTDIRFNTATVVYDPTSGRLPSNKTLLKNEVSVFGLVLKNVSFYFLNFVSQ